MMAPTEPLKTRHRLTDYLYWNLMLAIPVFTAALSIYHHSIFWLVVYLLLLGVTVTLILRFFCTRCPHYNREDRTLKCMFFWGLPKFFEPRPGALSTLDMVISFGPPVLLFLFPVFWLVSEPGLLIIYVLSLTGFAATMKRHECSRCIYYECPVNSTPDTLKDAE